MPNYNEGLTGQTVPYIEDDSYPIHGIREMPDTGRKTFYEWRDTKPESGKAIKEAKRYCLKSVTFVTFLNNHPLLSLPTRIFICAKWIGTRITIRTGTSLKTVTFVTFFNRISHSSTRIRVEPLIHMDTKK